MLAEGSEFDTGKMTDRGLEKKSSDMSVLQAVAEAAQKRSPRNGGRMK
jgi:hypothetical protein